MYYTETQTDMNVLGAISIESIQATGPSDLEENCFQITNGERDEWHLCCQSRQEREDWYCAINAALGSPCAEEGDAPIIIQEIERVENPIILINTPSPYCNEKWNYNKYGGDWDCKCEEGLQQSPIDLPKKEAATPAEHAAMFDYNRVAKENLQFVWKDGMI